MNVLVKVMSTTQLLDKEQQISVEWFKVEKEGTLIKGSVNTDKDKARKNTDQKSFLGTNLDPKGFFGNKRCWCVLSGDLLIYYKGEGVQEHLINIDFDKEKQPSGIIPLQYYTARLQTTRDEKEQTNKTVMILRTHFTGRFTWMLNHLLRLSGTEI